MEVEQISSESKTSKRKFKKLCIKIKKQMEFYFSDSNLAKDKFLTDLIYKDPEGYVHLEIFTSFNKIKALTENCDVIASSVSRSSLFEVSQDRKRVRRVTPLELSKDFDACTLYVEKLPAHADQKWIKDVFGHFGAIKYVNVPRYKVTNKIKGFAFVEFEDSESVKNACEFYKMASEKECTTSEDEGKNAKNAKKHKHDENSDKRGKKSRMRTTSESSDKLTDSLSQKSSHHHRHGASEKAVDHQQKHKRKRRGDSIGEAAAKKSKVDTDVKSEVSTIEKSVATTKIDAIIVDEKMATGETGVKVKSDSPEKQFSVKNEGNSFIATKVVAISKENVTDAVKKSKNDSNVKSEVLTIKQPVATAKISATIVDEKMTVGETGLKGKSNKPKKRSSIKNKGDSFMHTEEVDISKESVSEVSLNESELEDKTTDLDESKSKRKRRNSKKHRSHQADKKPPLRVMTKSEWKAYRNKYLELQRSTMSMLKKQILLELKKFKEEENPTKAAEVPDTKKAVKFQPGVIIKVKLPNPVKSALEIKDLVKANAVVAYVDAALESSEVFIRCHSPEDALLIMKDDKLKPLGKAELLKDDDEKQYWDKIESDRKIKYSNPVPHKKRGRDKLIAKAAKLQEMKNKHIFFL